MNYEESKAFINSNPQEHLQPDGTRKGYICPLCGSGSGAKGTGLALDPRDKSRTHWKCFACGFYGDMVELIAKENGIADGGSREAFEAARKAYRIEVSNGEYYTRGSAADFADEPAEVQPSQPNPEEVDPVERQKWSEANKLYIRECLTHIGETQYLMQRGISLETAQRYAVGYDPRTRFVIFPATTKDGVVSYNGRNTDPNSPKKHNKPTGKDTSGLFNAKALRESGPIFITEAAMDALSIIEAGGQAVGLNSTSGAALFISFCKQIQSTDTHPQHCYIAMDNDQPGQNTAASLLQALKGLGWSCSIVNVCGEHKDANEALMADREKLREAVAGALANVEAEAEKAAADALKSVRMSDYMEGFWAELEEDAKKPLIPTGFPKLDEYLAGGLYDGYYVITAESSAGKTAFMMQIADRAAKQGHDVLIFSLEMSTKELVSRSLSRITAEIELEENKWLSAAGSKSSSQAQILKVDEHWTFPEEKRENIYKAANRYKEFCENIYIVEGVGTVGVREVRRMVEEHISSTGRTPIVVVDYLQILAPYVDPERAKTSFDTKQSTDMNVLELKRISRDFKTPLFTVSSVNRSGYGKSIRLENLKESGAIEYTADVVIALQLEYRTVKGKVTDEAMAEMGEKWLKPMKVKILKNRRGPKDVAAKFEFCGARSFFIEQGGTDFADDDDDFMN